LGQSPFEQGKVFKKLIDLGWSEKDIAAKAGKSQNWITQLLTLQAQPEELKAMVRSGQVSATLAAEVATKAGNSQAAVETLTAASEAAKSAGRERVTRKHIEQGEKKKRVNLHDQLRSAFEASRIDESKRDMGFVIIRMKVWDYDGIRDKLDIEEL
jgi:hypothetical protein